MSRAIFAVLLVAPAVALAGGYADWVEVPFSVPDPLCYELPEYQQYLSEGHRTYDLLAVVDGGDRWDAGWAHAYFEGDPACGYTFWDHPSGGPGAPNRYNFAYFALLLWDSYWSSPEDCPNSDLDGDPASFGLVFAPGSPLQDSATDKEAEWSADPAEPNVYDGSWTTARFNVMGQPPGGCVEEETPYGVACELVIDGRYWFADGSEEGEPFQLRIPLCWYTFPRPGSGEVSGRRAGLPARLP